MKKVFTQAFLSLILAFSSLVALAQPANDLPCNAIAIVVDAAAALYDNTDATSEVDEVAPTIQNCQTGWCELDVDSSMWFTFVAPANGAVVINSCLDNSNLDLQVAVYEVTDCGDYATYTIVAANDDTPGGCGAAGASNFASTLSADGLTPGATYYLQADGYFGAVGEYFLEITTGIPLCKMKLVHNCADLAAAMVDIRVNGELLVDNFQFQTHTNFLDVLAQEEVSITVNPSNSTDDSEALYTLTTTLDPTANYIAIASGIVSGSGYSPSAPFALHVFDNAALANISVDMYGALIYHGSTDAPTVIDVENFNDGTTYFDNVTYGQFYNNDYVLLMEGLYSLDLTDAGGTPLGLTYCAPLQAAPQNILVIASGFVNPAVNSDGAPFGLYAVQNNFGGAFAPLLVGACVAPSNDQPCNATTLVVNNPPTFASNLFASGDENEAHPPGLACQDSVSWCAFDSVATISVWFKFIAGAAGAATVTTCLEGTLFDTQIAVYEIGNCSDYATYTLKGANDDAPGGCTLASSTFASNLNLTNLTPGNNYYVQVDGYNGQSNVFNIQVTAPVSVNELNAARAFSIFPNPVKDNLTVRYDGKAPMNIYDSRGALVLMQQVNGSAVLDVSQLATGVYTISVVEQNSVQTLRFVVE